MKKDVSREVGFEMTREWTLSAEHLSQEFGSTKALDDVTLIFKSGEIHGIVGHNGAGKSTLLQIFSGALSPTSGSINLDSSPISFIEPYQAYAAGIACVYQELSLPINLTIWQSLFLGHELRKNGLLDKKEMRRISSAICKDIEVDADSDTILSNLSVSQRQLLEIGAAINRKAKVILFDEPTTALEPTQISLLFSIMRKLAHEQNLIVVLVDHRLDEVLSVCDRVTALADGKIRLSGKKNEISIGNLTDAVIGNRERNAGEVITPDQTLKREQRKKSLLLEVRHLGSERLNDISLVLEEGEILGIYGLNGSGRSRFLRTLYGDLSFTNGEITLAGSNYLPSSPHYALSKGVAYLSEERKKDGFIPLLTPTENMTLPILHLYRRLRIFLNHNLKNSSALAILKKLNVRGDISGLIMRLSGGNQQKVLFARSIMQKPVLLLLDEPTKGIDIGAKIEIYDLIKSLVKSENIGVILVSSEEEEILSITDTVMIFRNGTSSGIKNKTSELDIANLRLLALQGKN